MTKELEKAIIEMEQAHEAYQKKLNAAKVILQSMAEFEVDFSYFHGDGFLIFNVDTSDVAMQSCLDGVTRRQKLSEDKHKQYSI